MYSMESLGSTSFSVIVCPVNVLAKIDIPEAKCGVEKQSNRLNVESRILV
jgi:hypothetical protein